MRGQWIGSFEGGDGGKITVNVDERESCFEGTAYLLEKTVAIPSSVVHFKSSDKQRAFKFRADGIMTLDPNSGVVQPWEAVKSLYPKDITFSQYADIEGSWDEDWLTLSWLTDTGVRGNSRIPRSSADAPSGLKALALNWAGFKAHVSGFQGRRYLFRGQEKPWRLRTTFHRNRRADLLRFRTQDIPSLYLHLSGRTRQRFNLQIPDEFGAFLNLAQHHGYPTPLLDWTYSPYVAAFFAYRRIRSAELSTGETAPNVRIFIFDQREWRADMEQLLFIEFPRLHLSVGDFLAFENERLIPQQAASVVTNVDDIETYIATRERDNKDKQYLTAIDLPAHQREEVMRDLTYMGITAGTLFPGLDGACEELRERNFVV
jgi:FRG domain